ncbi:MAG: 4Fe-4S binding protein [Candidatus Calescibacterium sp.]|nr:4Fe-4S binding protein [Candidatus Calescibacterium sp.]MCS7243733.1 4Fe-4S binding protein [Candidatus Calescibacterium sp.]MCX7758221.1 4Fe-4S binding protein [bacterium]MDW8132651.1 4Fe-4S binding protein [Candidatus Calescibacterium sp.]
MRVLIPKSKPSKGAVGKTGLWRTSKPVVNHDKCIKCVICWAFCPETTIFRFQDNSVDIDYEYCKGCGVCANECPVNAIEMVED